MMIILPMNNWPLPNKLCNGILFANNGLSYAPGSWFDGGASASTNISVSTTNPDKYIGVLKSLINKTKKKALPPKN